MRNPALYVTTLAAIALCAPFAQAKTWFAQPQVLGPDKAYDLFLWRTDNAPDAEARWACDGAAGSAFPPVACASAPYASVNGPREAYLDYAFYKAGPSTPRSGLATTLLEQREALAALERPLIAVKQRGDSCAWIALYREENAPSAAGKVACADLRGALAGIGADLEGRFNLVPKPRQAASGKRPLPAYAYGRESMPDRLDYGFEATAGIAIGMSGDETENAGTPFEYTKDAFDFDEFASLSQLPVGLRAYFTYCGGAGLRLGYAYSTYSLDTRVYDAFRNEIASQGGTLTGWDIARHDYSVELLLGLTTPYPGAELGLHGLIGVAKVDFSEKTIINGRTYTDGALKDQTTFLLGGGFDALFARHLLFGIEAALMIKSFELRGATTQPDGSGNEIQLRLRLGGFDRIVFGPK